MGEVTGPEDIRVVQGPRASAGLCAIKVRGDSPPGPTERRVVMGKGPGDLMAGPNVLFAPTDKVRAETSTGRIREHTAHPMDPVTKKPKSVHRLEERMGSLSPESLRYRVLESAKNFKSSWVELGQYLHAVYQDKLFKEWGYGTFEAYCAKEIGIRQPTAVKLLKSYYFLEKEEPEYLKRQTSAPSEDPVSKRPAETPSFEAVNALRLARQSDKISEKDYEKIREDVLDKGQEVAEIKKKIKYLLKASPAREIPVEERKAAAAKKMTAYLENALTELSNLSFPAKVLKKIEELLDLVQGYK